MTVWQSASRIALSGWQPKEHPEIVQLGPAIAGFEITGTRLCLDIIHWTAGQSFFTLYPELVREEKREVKRNLRGLGWPLLLGPWSELELGSCLARWVAGCTEG